MTGEIIRATCAATIRSAGGQDTREIEAILQEPRVDRMGEIVMTEGIDYRGYLQAGGVVLFNHDAAIPVARTTRIGIQNGQLVARAKFPEPGVSAKADEILGLIRSDVLSAVSIGFIAKKTEPMDPKKPWGPQRYIESTLVEWSVVSAPALPSARITAKSAQDRGRDAARRQLARFRLVELRRQQRALEQRLAAGGAISPPEPVMLTGADADRARERARTRLALMQRD